MPQKSRAITVALIGAAGLIVAAAVGAILQPSWWQFRQQEKAELVIAGTVVDGVTNVAIAQANISLVGRPETYVTEDNGNFRIVFPPHVGGGSVRIHVFKDGYKPYDVVISPPAETLIIPLRKM